MPDDVIRVGASFDVTPVTAGITQAARRSRDRYGANEHRFQPGRSSLGRSNARDGVQHS